MSSRRSLAAQAADLAVALRSGGLPEDSAALIDLIGELETLKSAACAAQGEAAVAYDAARRSVESAQGVPARRQGRGVAAEIALARRESPHRGQTLLGLGKILHHEMPHTRARLADGRLSEFRAILLVRETACLTAEQRLFVDEELCADPAALDGIGTRELVARAKRAAYEIDPAAVVRRARNAESDRNVTVRPAPDTMTYLTSLLPVAQGVAVHAVLGRDADALRAKGDTRGRGQLMADLLVARITGADLVPDAPTPVPVMVNLTMADTTLLGGHRPAEIGAEGVVPETVPAEIARCLLSRALTADVGAWIRQLYVNHTGRLIGMTSKQRLYADGLADFLSARDLGICRTPFCDAPIRHRDHVQPVHAGGETTADNGQGLCEACNQAKEAPDWRQWSVDDLRHTVEIRTPTGHRYRSQAPPPVGWREPRWVNNRPGVYTLVA
ncbi:HNH endonuclease [Nocardioides pelophilus]|uniref:HNH endonuclease n=1 Tax=Nocardioides pelophilus TaxID=2172019 RepID=UPI0016016F2E|nr:HNH endonuclease [Nocardioides pelophilus]